MLVPFSMEIQYLALIAASVLLFGLLHRFLWKGRLPGGVSLMAWLLVLGVLGGGWVLTKSAIQHERQQVEQTMKGYAPTFAQEISLMGHEEVTEATSPDNPRYWRMIAAEKRWLAANPLITDIYTLRKLKNGHVVLLVDSETDFDHNGRFEGDREQRTPIGQPYEDSLPDGFNSVVAGQSIFQERSKFNRSDRGLRSLAPIPNFRGDLEAVLGVDFDASTITAASESAQWTTMGFLAAILFAMAGVSVLFLPRRVTGEPQGQLQSPTEVEPQPQSPPQAEAQPQPRVQSESQSRAQEKTSLEKAKLEALINSIDGVIWEADARTLAFTFVSQQAEGFLGYPHPDWLTVPDFRKSKLHPDDRYAHDHFVKMVAAKAPYSHDFRMMTADGRDVWIRESATILLDEAGEPLLIRGFFNDISAQKRAAEELENANAKLVDSSRYAGMAEVATGVLHNVGNVLNSVNISGSVISERLRASKVIELGKVAGLLTLQKADFAGFVARDPRGPHIPELISCVTDAIRAEHVELLEEVESITRNISHIKEIVSMQQGFAKGAGIIEPLRLENLVDDAIKINAIHLTRHQVNVVQAYEEVPKVLVDKHLVLQILVNLLRNAQQAIEVSDRHERRIVVKIQNNGGDFVKVTVQDSGGGIAPENLNRIFSHGFTTKKTGHGFGLHSSALAATGMGGALTVHSDGPGTGATFSLNLPVFEPALVASAA